MPKTIPSGDVAKELAKIERFRRIASGRANRALDYIESLMRTADRGRYSFTDEQAQEVVTKLRQAVDQLELAYAGTPSRKLRVEL